MAAMSDMMDSGVYWLVGAVFDGADQAERFLREGV